MQKSHRYIVIIALILETTLIAGRLSARQYSRNLIPNPSFEDHETLSCNSGISRFWFWFDAEESGSPDYHAEELGFECKYSRIREASDGNFCIGFYTLGEAIRTTLKMPLKKGEYYTLSLDYEVDRTHLVSNNWNLV